MSTAQKFYADGRGNGFPFCGTAVNVNDVSGVEVENWVTLGGTKKGDALSGSTFEDQRELSLKNAMKIFWNAYQIIGVADNEVSGNQVANHVLGINIRDGVETLNDHKTPLNRVCGFSFNRSNADNILSATNIARIGSNGMPLSRLFVGSDFVGWAIGSWFSNSLPDFAYVQGRVVETVGDAELACPLVIINSSNHYQDPTGANDYFQINNISLGGIPMLEKVFSDSFVNPNGRRGDNIISDLEFYTYA